LFDYDDLKKYISQNSVAAQLRSGGIFNNSVIANVAQSKAVKKKIKNLSTFAESLVPFFDSLCTVYENASRARHARFCKCFVNSLTLLSLGHGIFLFTYLMWTQLFSDNYSACRGMLP